MLFLEGSASARFLDGSLQALRHDVSVKKNRAPDVPGSSSRHLYQGTIRTEKSLSIGVKNCHERDFGQVYSFPQKIDTDKNIKSSLTDVPKKVDSLESIKLGVDVTDLEAQLAEVLR